MGTPRVSFVLPVLNGKATLESCLRHIQGQTLRQWECIAVDDGSSDGSPAIVEAFASRDPRFRLIRHESNRGVGAARQTGLCAAAGDAVHFVDQDDHLLPDGIERLHRVLARLPEPAAVFGNFLAVHSETGRQYRWESYPSTIGFSDLVERSPFTFLNVLHRRTLVLDVGGLASSVDGCDEWDLWGRLTRTGRRLHHGDVDVGEYRLHGLNASLNAERLLTSGLKVLDVLHRSDARVPNPAPEWRDGAPAEGRTRRQLRFFWLQTANCLARDRVDEAIALVTILEECAGNGLISDGTVGDLHGAMKYGCMLAGTDPARYLLELRPVLDRYFVRLEARLGLPGFASAAQKRLLETFLESMLSENGRLRGAVETYRTSRSYRIGRALTRTAGKLLRSVRG